MAGNWERLNQQPGFAADTMLLLTDGRVLCHELDSSNWHCLTADASGSYRSGAWTSVASFADNPTIPATFGGPTYAPTYFASAVLRDGRVFVAGGEYNNGGTDPAELAIAQLYDPVADSWTDITPANLGWIRIGDAPSCVLPDGRVLLGSIDDSRTAIFDPVVGQWAAASRKGDAGAEETWTLLPDDTVLVVQCSNAPRAEKYIVAQNAWVQAGSTPSDLTQPCSGETAEIGPAILLPDGRVFAVGASGDTALYSVPGSPQETGSWQRGPNFGCRGRATFIAARIEGKGAADLIAADNVTPCTTVMRWSDPALAPRWTGADRITGPAGDWLRGNDLLVAADIDNDGADEIVIASAHWTGVLKWNSGGLSTVWMSPSPLDGPAGGWIRNPTDFFIAADVDGDGQVEIVIANNQDQWLGVLKWNGAALLPIWMSPSPLNGPAGGWIRNSTDLFTAADVDGDDHMEIVIANNQDKWTGVLKWIGGALVPVWMSPSPLKGPAGGWIRGDDLFIAADIDGDARDEIIIANNQDKWTGVLKWDGGAMVPIWMSPSPLEGAPNSWPRDAADLFIPADVDADGQVEIVMANNPSGYTGVLKWNGVALIALWISTGDVIGAAGDWIRRNDSFAAVDIDGDGHLEVFIANMDNHWAGVLRWDGQQLGPVWMAPNNGALFAMDAPAALLPNGKVLCAASPGNPCSYIGPTYFFEYDAASNTLLRMPKPTNSDGPCFSGRMLLLPTGEVLFTNGTTEIQMYAPDGAPDDAWRPTISSAPATVNTVTGQSFTLTGTQLNGRSQAVSYGDDASMATNYPLIRISASDGNVYYCRTSNHSTMAVATGGELVGTTFSLPTNIPDGTAQLVVVANGIASQPFAVSVVTPQGCANALAAIVAWLQRLFSGG